MAIQNGTILAGMNIRRFDLSLTLWMMNARNAYAARMIAHRSRACARGASEYFEVFRRAYSHYAEKMILPYLVLPGPIEIDESKVNHKKFHCNGGYITIRWMFGLFCRKTKIAILYSIKDKTMNHLVPIMKKHVPTGGTIFSDSHMSYCNMNNGTSKLSSYGFFHMWTNHSFRMVHEKFPFNNTLSIERSWSEIKRICYSIKNTFNYDKI